MLSLDLFNTKYERELREGAVDNLEARRIDILNDRMQELLSRAKESQYKNNPAALAGLKKEYQRFKDERDSYYKVREAGIPGNIPTEKIPGKEDLLKGKGRTYYEGAEDYASIYSPEAIALGKRFCEHYNITDDGDVQLAVEIIDSYLDEFKATNTPVDLKKIRSGVADAFRQVYRGMGPGPNFRKKFQEAEQSPRAYGAANFQRLVKANMGNIPTVNFEFIRPEENFKLDQRGLDLISDYYDGLANDQAKNYFIYRVLPSGDETLTVLKQLGWTPAHPVQQELPGMPTQGELPLQEKKKSDDNLKAGDIKVARELQKLRARYPAVRSDIEAVASAEIDSTERSQQQLAAIRGANEKQDALLKQLVSLDQEQGREINGLDQENNSLEQRLAQVQATNDRLQQAVGQMTGTKKVAAKTQKTASQGSRDIAQGGIIDVDAAITSTPDTTSSTNTKPTTSPAMASMAQQIQGLSKAAPSIRPAPGVKAANEPIQQQPKVVGSDITEHGGGIGPRQHWQDLMPEQLDPEDDDWYDDEEDQETELRSGDYVRDTMDGESGEIFRMQGDPYERRVRILDRDGKGWYIEPSRLARVDPTDPDVQRYFGKKRVRDMDEAVDEKGALKSAQAAAKFIIRNLDDRAALKDYSMHFWSPEKFYQGATMAMRGAGHDEIVKHIVQDRPAQFESANDQVKQVFKDKAGRPVGEIGVDPESSPGNGEWYVYHYATGYSVVGFDSAAEAKRELMYVHKHPDAVEEHPSTKEQGVAEGWSDRAVAQRTGQPRTPYAVYIKGKKWKDFENEELAQAVADKLRAKFKADGRDPETVTIAPTDMSEGLKSTLAGAALAGAMALGGAGAAQAQSAASGPSMANATTIIQQIQAGKIQNQNDLASALGNASNKQVVFKILQAKAGLPGHGADSVINALAKKSTAGAQQPVKSAGQSGSIVQRPTDNFEGRINEEQDSSGVERAILNRIMVAHTDLLMKYGPDKVMQAAEEVAYNVGDVDEIGTSDVSAYVAQVKQILGATA
jgi:hypothetical protein